MYFSVCWWVVACPVLSLPVLSLPVLSFPVSVSFCLALTFSYRILSQSFCVLASWLIRHFMCCAFFCVLVVVVFDVVAIVVVVVVAVVVFFFSSGTRQGQSGPAGTVSVSLRGRGPIDLPVQ